MEKFTAKINDLGMIELPKEICKALGLKEKSAVYISVEDKKVVLRNSYNLQTVIARKLDEFNRIALPWRVRQYLRLGPSDEVLLELVDNKVILMHGI